ncbi:MAG: hypothetical protein V3U67_03715 [Gemmatimonadota bacterium]
MKLVFAVRWGLRLCAGAAAVILIAAPLAAQESVAERLRDILPAEAAAQIEAIAARAQREGVPPGLIYRKAQEGVAKRVPPQRIVLGVGEYAGRLAHASRLLNGRRHAATLDAAAKALNNGVPPAVIRELGRSRSRNLAIPLRVVTDLSEVGVPPPLAVGMMKRELEAGAQPRHLLAASTAIKRMVRRGEAPEKAIREVGKRLSEARQRRRTVRPGSGGDGNRTPGTTDGQAVPRRPGTTDGTGGASPTPTDRRDPPDSRIPTDRRTPPDAREPERRRPTDGVRPAPRPANEGARRRAGDGVRR